MPLRVALTGGAGSGKSTAALEFSRLGVPTLDTDDVSRQLLSELSIQEAVHHRFPEYALAPDTLDRRQLRARIARDRTARVWLERLLHPRIWASVQDWLARQPAPYAVVSVPLLFESGWAPRFDTVVMLQTPHEARLRRLEIRDGLVPEQAQQLLAAQASDAPVRSIAHVILDNSGELPELLRQVRYLDVKLRHPSAVKQLDTASILS